MKANQLKWQFFLLFCINAISINMITAQEHFLMHTNMVIESNDSPTDLTQTKNLGRRMSFGFLFGITTQGFSIKTNDNIEQYGFNYVSAKSGYGMHAGIISNFRLNDQLDIMFVPGFSFSDRAVQYSLNNATTNNLIKQEFDPYFIELPLLIKYTYKRNEKFRPYLVGGVKYLYDYKSFENKFSGNFPLYLRTRQEDYAGIIGLGTQIKISNYLFTIIEFTANIGFRNLVLPGCDIVSPKYYDAIDTIRSSGFNLSIKFLDLF